MNFKDSAAACCAKNEIIIAIDGHSSCGKSTFAKAIAAKLGYIFIDTGAMYRAVTYAAIRQGIIDAEGVLHEEGVEPLLSSLSLSFKFNEQRGASDMYIGDELVEGAIRTLEVSSHVSQVSAVEIVRTRLTHMQREMGRQGGVVMDGRDIGTAVFPDAQLKIFLTADAAVRAQRRFIELTATGANVTLEDIERNIRERDHADENRTIAPLKRATDALLLDNSAMSVAEQMGWFDQQFNRVTNAQTAG